MYERKCGQTSKVCSIMSNINNINFTKYLYKFLKDVAYSCNCHYIVRNTLELPSTEIHCLNYFY